MISIKTRKKQIILFLLSVVGVLITNTTYAASYTTTQNGDWSNASTWSPAAVPGDGDTVTIQHNVTVTNNQAIGTGADTAIQIDDSGALRINPNLTLTVKGNIIASGTITLEEGSNLAMNTTNSSKIQLTPGTTSAHLQINGTETNRASVKAIGNGYTQIIGNDWQEGSGRVVANYCDFDKLGDSSHPAISYILNSNGDKYSFKNCTFNQCGQIVTADRFSVPAGGYIEFINSKWINSTGEGNSDTNSGYILETWSNYGTTFKVIGCDFDKRVGVFWQKDCEIEDNVFRDGVQTDSEDWWGGIAKTFKHNFIRWNGTGRLSLRYGSTIEDNIIIMDNPAGWNPHFGNIAWGTGTTNIKGNIWWWTGNDINAEGDGLMIGGATSGTRDDNTVTFEKNIFLPNAEGYDASNGLSTGIFNILETSSNKQVVVKRNTAYTGAGQGGINMGESGETTVGDLAYAKSNLFIGSANNNGIKARNVEYAVTDTFQASDVDYNGGYRLKNSNTGAGSGKGYMDFTFSGSDIVGQHDIDDQDPQFVDPNRTPASWAGSLDATMDRLSPGGGYTMTQLLDYIREGFRPQNNAFKGAGDPADGSPDMGAVEVSGE